MESEQVFFPVHAPFHPLKTDPSSGRACSVTVVGGGNSFPHVAPQLMPAGVLVTVPRPVPLLFTPRACGIRVNVAVTERAWSIVTWQVVAEPEQSPDQLVNVEVDLAVSVMVTAVLLSNEGSKRVST